jgi:large repetitive protein
MKCIKFTLLFILLFQYTNKTSAQLSGLPACTAMGQTPNSAFPACLSTTLSPSLVTACSNGVVIVPQICLDEPSAPTYESVRPYWYEFTCYQAGLLSFSIAPISALDDYDWQLYDVTGLTPAQIATQVFTNINLIVAANWAGLTGVSTGASAAGTSAFVCATNGTGNSFSNRPSLILNHNYLLLVSNFSASQQGFNLTFGTTGAVIVNPLLPALLNATAICGNTEIRIKTNKKMICSSLASNGSDFTIIAPGGATINPISAAAVDCQNGKFNFDSLSVFVGTALAPGVYTIRSKNGTDGNTIKDNCDNFIPVGIDLQFTVVPIPPAPTVTSPVTYCQNKPSVTLTAVGSNLLWYTSATGGTGSTSLIPSTTNAGSTIYYVSQNVGNCESARSAITVVVNPTPVLPASTSPITYCQNATPSILTATGTGILWYTAPSGGVGSSTAPTPTTTTSGNTTYYVTQTLLTCESLRKPIVVSITATPALPAVVNPLPYCKNAAAVSLSTSVSGSNLLWYTNPTGGTGVAVAPIPSTTSAGTTTYYVSQTINSCEGPRASITVTVIDLPSEPTNITSPINYCKNAIAVPLTATGTNLLWYTPLGAGFIVTTAAPTPSTANVGTIVYQVSQTVNGCEGPKISISVIVNPIPTAPIVNTPVAYCQNANTSALTANGTNLLWYSSPSGGVGSVTPPTPASSAGGSTIYYVSQTINNCESPRAAITVNVTATPAAPTFNNNPLTYCQGVTIPALTANGSNLLWYAAALGGTGSNTAPAPSSANIGSTVYYVSQSVNSCEGPRAALTVIVNITPAAPTTNSPTIVYCQNELSSALVVNGTNLLWYSNPTTGTGITTAPTPSTANVGNTIYYVSQTIGICEGPRTAITITVNATPPAPTATSPITYCQAATATALSATGTNLLWYLTATNGVGNSNAPVPNTSNLGTTTYYVSSTLGNCEGPRKAIIVNINPIPAAPNLTTTSYQFCQGLAATILSVAGSGGASLLWYTTSTGGTGNSLAPTPSSTSLGTTNYYVSQVVNGCEGPRQVISVNINPTPAAPIVITPIVYCQFITPNLLTANGTNLLWYTAASGGTGVNVAPAVSTNSPGNTNYYVTQTVNGCESPRSLITVTVNAQPPAPTVISFVGFCQGSNPTPLTAVGTNLLWYTSFSGGIGNSTAPSPPTNIVNAFNSYFVSQTIANCEGPRAQIFVSIKANPPAPVVNTPIVYCQGETATAVPSTGVTSNWYTVPVGGQINGTPLIPSTTAVGNTPYYIATLSLYAFNNTPQTFLYCESPRTPINIIVNITPAAPTAISPLTYCQNKPTVALVANGTNLLWYASATGGTGSAIAPIPSSTNAGTFTFYVTQKTGNCESSRTAIVVNITATPPLPIVVPIVNYCPGGTAVPLTATGTNLLWYTTAVGGTGTTTAPLPSTTTGNPTTSYYVSQTINGCEGPRAEIKVVIINNGLTVTITPSDTTICEGKSVKIEPIVTPSATSYQWNAIGVPNSTIDSIFSKNATFSPVDTGIYVLKATRNGCITSAQIKVNVIWKPKIDAGKNVPICLYDSTLLKGIITHASSDSITYNWTPSNGLTNADSINTYAKPALSTWYKLTYQTKVTYGCDFSGYDSVKVIVQPVVKAFAGNDTIAVTGRTHQLHATGGLDYMWSSLSQGVNILSPNSQNAFVTLYNDAYFTLKVTDAIGCEGRDSIFIKVYDGPNYYVPNSFTPNGDGLNDIFRAIPAGISNTVYFRVFNRFGQLMFETNQWLKGWDGNFKGKEQPSGAYVWMIAGTDKDNKKITLKGSVMLIR